MRCSLLLSLYRDLSLFLVDFIQMWFILIGLSFFSPVPLFFAYKETLQLSIDHCHVIPQRLNFIHQLSTIWSGNHASNISFGRDYRHNTNALICIHKLFTNILKLSQLQFEVPACLKKNTII